MKLRSLTIPNLNLSEKIGKVVTSKSKFRIFLQLNSPNFELKLWGQPHIYQNCPKFFRGDWRELEAKSCFHTIMGKIFLSNSSFYVK